MNRRDFLHGRHLLHSTGQILGALDELTSPQTEEPREANQFVRVSRRAMATSFEILLPVGTPRALDAAQAGLDEVDRLEEQLTVFRASSEVSRLNGRAGAEAVPVADNLFQLLALSSRISAETGGAFDVTSGALTKAWGFFRRQQRVPAAQELQQVLSRTGMKHVVLDAEHKSVRFLRPGLEINLGSIGKGYALDRVAELLRGNWKISSALLHGGHSSVYAIGIEPRENRGWAVGILHPWEPERRLGTVWLRDRALATSAASFQHLEHRGRKLGHIIDPRTGWPAESLASATVVAASAAEADALATAFFILGIEPARAYCATHPEIGALLLPPGEHALPLTFGLACAEVKLPPA